ncbi:MAG: hypothetical protein V7707_11990 [Motiliproteus sp.]
MIKQLLGCCLLVVTMLLSPLMLAAEVSSVTACKPDGEVWLCATWKDGRTGVYRSKSYISSVEFKGAVEADSIANASPESTVKMTDQATHAANYTLQLLACNADTCRDTLQQLQQIPDSRVVELKQNNSLWQVLLVGHYGSIKTAQQAAAELMETYKLRDKPWVRTLDSVSRRQVSN